MDLNSSPQEFLCEAPHVAFCLSVFFLIQRDPMGDLKGVFGDADDSAMGVAGDADDGAVGVAGVPRGQFCWRLGLECVRVCVPRGQSCWRLGLECVRVCGWKSSLWTRGGANGMSHGLGSLWGCPGLGAEGRDKLSGPSTFV